MIDLGIPPIENGTYRYPCGNFVVIKDNKFTYIYYANDDRIWLKYEDNQYIVTRIKTYDGCEFIDGKVKKYR